MALVAAAAPAQEIPDGVTVSQWVREDLFAGFLADSQQEFSRGLEKLSVILERDPENPSALSWRAGAEIYQAVRALEGGREAEFERLFASGWNTFGRVHETAPDHVSVLAVTGGTMALFADRFPADRRRAGWELGRERYLELERLQNEVFDRMPEHHRGEVLGGLAQFEQRLGNRTESLAYADRIAATLAGTPYEAPARRYLDEPTAEERPIFACKSCHDPNRLANLLARSESK